MKTPHEVAVQSRDCLKYHESEDLRCLIVEIMIGFGDYDEWMDVFWYDADMLNRFKVNKHKIQQREPLLVDYTDR